MNYEKIYFDYMAYCKTLNRDPLLGYLEKHHVYPKSVYPERKDDPENLVLLTAREHFLAHLTLCKIFELRGDQKSYGKMVCAFALMSKIKRYSGILSSRIFQRMREAAAIESSNRQKGKKLSEEHRKNLSKSSAWKGKPGPMRGRKHTDSAKQKNAEKHKGKVPVNKGVTGVYVCTEETRKKLSIAAKGRGMSEQAKSAISIANTGTKYYYSLITGQRRRFRPGTQPEEFVVLTDFKNSSLYKQKEAECQR